MRSWPYVLSWVLAGCCVAAASGAETRCWRGACGPPEDRRPLVLRLAGDEGPGWLDLESGGLLHEPLARVHATADSLVFVLASDLGDVVFAGVRTPAGVHGRMRFGPFEHPFDLAPDAHDAAPPPGEDVVVPSGDVRLAGTFFRPAGPGPFPAVVFLHGSGDQPRLGVGDRDRVEAYTRAGVAVLVYDKRGIGGSTGDHRRVGLGELAEDGLAAWRWLGARRDVLPGARGFDGRSQGCWLAEMAAAREPAVAFVVAQVGGGVAPWRQELFRVEAELRAAGVTAAALDSGLAWTRLHYGVARGDSTWERYQQVAAAARGRPWLTIKRPYASPEQAHASWTRLSAYEPAADLAKFAGPMLAVLAAEDRSTPTELTVQALRAAARPAGAPPIDVRVLPGVGHELLEFPASGIPRRPAGYPDLVARWVRDVGARGH